MAAAAQRLAAAAGRRLSTSLILAPPCSWSGPGSSLGSPGLFPTPPFLCFCSKIRRHISSSSQIRRDVFTAAEKASLERARAEIDRLLGGAAPLAEVRANSAMRSNSFATCNTELRS